MKKIASDAGKRRRCPQGSLNPQGSPAKGLSALIAGTLVFDFASECAAEIRLDSGIGSDCPNRAIRS